MANELVPRAGQALAVKGASAIEKHAKKAAKHAAKKHAAKKHAAKKHAKKAAKHAAESGEFSVRGPKPASKDLARAFHHLQRASAVISLVEAESGNDLKQLLKEGTKLYGEAAAGENEKARPAAELLRATEHLAMAGLYAARGGRQARVEEPADEDMGDRARAIESRLDGLELETGYGARLHAIASELLRRAEGSDHDAHLAWELLHGADGICAALEAGLE